MRTSRAGQSALLLLDVDALLKATQATLVHLRTLFEAAGFNAILRRWSG